MSTTPDAEWAEAMLELVTAPSDPSAALTELIERLDRSIREGDETIRTAWLTRAIIAGGRLLTRVDETWLIESTIAAAETFVLDPNDATELAYFEASTATYPFGAGEGCYSTRPDLGCAPGSGCRTGAGCLASIAYTTGAAPLLEEIERELRPWVLGRGDPVADRARRVVAP